MTNETATKEFQPQQIVVSSVVGSTNISPAVFNDVHFIDPKDYSEPQSYIILNDLNTSTFTLGLTPYQYSFNKVEEFTGDEVQKLKKSISNFYNGKQATRKEIMEILK